MLDRPAARCSTPLDPPPYDPVLAQRIVAEARGWIGTPYRHQASLRGVGCDCLGLVRGVWRAVIGPEPEASPPYAPDWGEAAGDEPMLAAALRHFTPLPAGAHRPGDLLLFRWREGCAAKHAGLASDPGRMIHAHDGAEVAEVALLGAWRARLAGAFRFPASLPDASTPPL